LTQQIIYEVIVILEQQINIKNSESLCSFVKDILESHKGADILSIDLRGKSSIADFLVIASGTSRRHVSALSQHVKDGVEEKGLKPLSIEGVPQCDWALLDLGDVIVHVFYPEIRAFYNLEKMWDVPESDADSQKNKG
jgi:ribosome-associated protein